MLHIRKDIQTSYVLLRPILFWCHRHRNMTLNTQREKETLRRRGSTPIHPAHIHHPSWTQDTQLRDQREPELCRPQRSHPPLGQSASYHPGDKSLHYRVQWSSDSDDDSQSDSDCVYRVMLLGDHGVGKTSLAGIFAGITEKDEQPAGGMSDSTLISNVLQRTGGQIQNCSIF